jgi:hypothetical protein
MQCMYLGFGLLAGPVYCDPQAGLVLLGRFRPQYFLTRTGVT